MLRDVDTRIVLGGPHHAHGGQVSSLAFSRDGSRMASGSWDGTVRLWDGTTGQPISRLPASNSAIFGVAFSPDGKRIVSGSWLGTVLLQDAATGAVVGVPHNEHASVASSVAFSPDGRRIISGGHDTTLRLQDAATGTPLGEPLGGHTEAVFSVAFSPDGARIVSGGADQTVRLWRVGQPDRLCAKLEGNLSHAEWKRYIGDVPYMKQCPGLPVPSN